MEADGSFLHSQQLSTRPCFEPDQSSPCPPSHFLKIHFIIILPPTPGSSTWSISLRFSHQHPVHKSLLLRTCYTPRPSHCSWFV